jgi:hypothetical protein
MIILDTTIWIEYLKNNEKYYSAISRLLDLFAKLIGCRPNLLSESWPSQVAAMLGSQKLNFPNNSRKQESISS